MGMMNFGEFIIYADESGDHSLDAVDRDFPIFVLDFCIFRKDHYLTAVVPAVQKFKFQHFGHDLVVLHEHDMRKQKPPFVFLKSESKRVVFMDGLNEIIRSADFTIIAAVIDKQRLTGRYRHPDNPYEIALKFCMERAYAFLRDRGQHLNRKHTLSWKSEATAKTTPWNWLFGAFVTVTTNGVRCQALRLSLLTSGLTQQACNWQT